jgi:deoxycytidylate deaminase
MFDDEGLLQNIEEKLTWICHAESNAILNAARTGAPMKGSSIYVTKFPCFACCNSIVQAGIARIYTHDDKYWDDDPWDKEHTRKMKLLGQARIRVDAPFHPDFSPCTQLTLARLVGNGDSHLASRLINGSRPD